MHQRSLPAKAGKAADAGRCYNLELPRIHSLRMKFRDMKIIFLILSITTSLAVNGQQFSFQMFFADAVGNKDTITLGYDIAATDSIDVDLGETNIIGIPRNTALDVRITNEWRNRTWNGVPGTYHTKKQLVASPCLNFSYSNIQAVDIHTNNWPVTVTWDSSLFNDSCKMGSVFTSINPGGWWDTDSPSNLYQQVMADTDSATFTTNVSSWYNENYAYIQDSDTIPVFWQAIAPVWIISALISENVDQQITVNAYPNPFSQHLTFSISDNSRTTISVCNLLGQQQLQQAFINSITIDTGQLAEGIYIYKLQNERGFIETGTIVKK